MNLTDVRVIGQVLETTWGQQSSPGGTYSIKYSLQGDVLVFMYTTVVYFMSNQSLRPQVDRSHQQAIQLIDAKVGDVKKNVKDVTGDTLKLTDIGGDDNIEMIQATANSERKIAYYRYNHSYKIEE